VGSAEVSVVGRDDRRREREGTGEGIGGSMETEMGRDTTNCRR
jgi:hypothetical protein